VFTLGLLLMGTGASAQPPPRELKSRRIVLSSNEADSVHSIRLATGVLTTLSFEDTAIDARALQLEGQGVRIKLVDMGEHTVVLKPLVELAQGERLLLRVPFADGNAPTQATFALVSHPSEVDSQVEVIRQPQSAETCQGELAEGKARLAEKDTELQSLRIRAAASGPAGLILAGLLGEEGVKTVRSKAHASPAAQGVLRLLRRKGVLSFRAAAWAAVAVEVKNIGEQPWKPGTARLVSMTMGTPAKGVSASMEGQTLAPGECTLVVVETEAPPANAGELFRLEMFGADGARDLSISGVRVHNPREGVKP
jgi:uncharacterized protein (TIGR02268 family)